MLGILLKVLGVLGFVLLAVLLLILIVLLFILFCPISYHIYGIRNVERMEVKVKIKWLLGILRVTFCYPNPGNLVARVVGIKVLDTGKKKEKKSSKKNASQKNISQKNTSNEPKIQEQGDEKDGLKEEEEPKVKETELPASPDSSQESTPGEEEIPRLQMLTQKWEKLRDSAVKIIEKVKMILDNLSYYLELLREEDTRLLFASGMFRLGKILKSIRPRKIKGNIYIGTGSPDTTGYCMAAYGMLSPYLGKTVSVTPDFEETVLQGELFVRGRITIVILLLQGGIVMLDRRLRVLLKKLKREDK